jgi:serine/threonine-protein kinase
MVGQNIGKYRVIDRVGRGGMGTVYRAIDETLHREVAIKVLNAELNDPTVARRFRAEAVTVARLNHPGIATVYELFQNDGQWLMVMEFLRGKTLEHLVSESGPQPIERAADLCMQALAALAHAHSLGVVHRDLKPANLMVNDSGAVKVMDFGIARVAGTEHLTSAGFMLGTPAYMAPEQVRGEDIDARTDLFAMGVVLYYLASGKLPFKGETPLQMAQSRLQEDATPIRTVMPELPDWFGSVVARALERDPARRFESAPVFREALRRGLANLPIETPAPVPVPPELVATAAPGSMPLPIPPIPPRATAPPPASMPTVAASNEGRHETVPVSSPRRSRTGLLAGAAALIVVLAGAGWFAFGRKGAPEAAAPLAANTAAAPTPSAVLPDAPPAAAQPVPDAATPPAGPADAAARGEAPGAVAPDPNTTVASAPAAARAAIPPPTAAGRSGGNAARGAGPAADPHLVFADVRTLVFSGKKAEEQTAVLNLFNGQIAVISARNGATLAAIPYGDLTYAVYAHAKDPKWSVVLASPPADPDLPGGLFRSARDWLTLQSRSTFMILRLSENNWRRVVQAVSDRTGVQVEVPAGTR